MKQKKKTKEATTAVETPLLTGQYPGFGIEIPDGDYSAKEKEKKSGQI